MDAPKGRYRVEEKNGRLIVIDTATGAPVSPPVSAPPGSPPRPSAPRRSGPVSPPPPGGVDRLAGLLLRLAVKRWDDEGRAIIAWEWQENGQTRRWDAALDPAQQKRLGRALLAFAAFPLVVLLSIVGGFGFLWFLPAALPATFWGVFSVMRLRRETDG